MGTLWTIPLLGTVVALAIVGLALLIRSWPRHGELSSEERAEMAQAPMPPLQRRGWWGLLIGGLTFGVITTILSTQGAVAYWNDDGLRLVVVGIFIGGLLAHVLVTGLPALSRGGAALDERDRAILARAPMAQTTVVLLALAAWLITLGERFHDEGAVPMVYLYLIFGSVVLLIFIGQSLGILMGYWLGAGDGQG
jgi:hypothetical protein